MENPFGKPLRWDFVFVLSGNEWSRHWWKPTKGLRLGRRSPLSAGPVGAGHLLGDWGANYTPLIHGIMKSQFSSAPAQQNGYLKVNEEEEQSGGVQRYLGWLRWEFFSEFSKGVPLKIVIGVFLKDFMTNFLGMRTQMYDPRAATTGNLLCLGPSLFVLKQKRFSDYPQEILAIRRVMKARRNISSNRAAVSFVGSLTEGAMQRLTTPRIADWVALVMEWGMILIGLLNTGVASTLLT